jgi:hypothetical protein
MVILNEEYRIRSLSEQSAYLNVVIKDIREIERVMARDRDKGREIDPGQLEKLIKLQRSIWHGAEVFASLIQEGDNKRYIVAAQKFGKEAMYAIGSLPSNLAKAGHFAESAQYHERAKEEMYKLAQLQQKVGEMQQQERRGREGNLERSAGGENTGEREEGFEGRGYSGKGREYGHAEENRKGVRREHQGGGNLRYRNKKSQYQHGLNALIGLAGIGMIVLSGMPHITGGVIGGEASGYAQIIGGFLVLLAIGWYFVIKNRL